MLKFFRNIRKNLINEGKSINYLKYAIGEIVLVVIGILIALQINIWNEERKSIEKANNLLAQVQKELLENIKTLNSTIEYYRDKDSLLYKILNKKLSYEDYKSRPKYFGVIMNIVNNQIVDDAFKNLIAFDGKFSLTQDSLVKDLKILYGPIKEFVNKSHEMAYNSHLDFYKMLKKEKKWFYILSSFNEHTDEMINYYLTDPFYLNEVSEYEHAGLGNHFRSSLSFFMGSIYLYEKLTEQLKLETDTSVIKDLKDYQQYIGNYSSDSLYTFTITTEDNFLIMKERNNKDSTKVRSTYLFPSSKTYFTISDGTFGQLTYDENNEVNGFINSRGAYKKEFKKLNNDNQ
jgi:hypothetical protein